MADYRKMYMILCAAIDDVIDPLERIPLAHFEVEKLRAALLSAEEVYIDSSPDSEETSAPHIIPLKRNNDNVTK
ncbi:MAG: hypothetical protein IJJ99_04965 [Oscillospiraceae bacterium]|nr:hypothetical protein [Oscillospiraceae bacterium]